VNIDNVESLAIFRLLWRDFDYGNDLSREDRDGIRSARHYRNKITAVGYCQRKVCRQVRNNGAGTVDPWGLSRCGVNQARKRQHDMLKNSNEGYNISPKSWDAYPAIGRDGTFISNKQGVMKYFPHAGNVKEITITRAKA